MTDALSPLRAAAETGEARVLAADIGGSFVKLAAADGGGLPIARASLANPSTSWPDFVGVLASLCEAADPRAG